MQLIRESFSARAGSCHRRASCSLGRSRAAAVLAVALLPLAAQTTVDADGARHRRRVGRVADAQIGITDKETNQVRGTRTSANGDYADRRACSRARTTVRVQRVGFAPASQEIRLLVGQRATLDFAMQESRGRAERRAGDGGATRDVRGAAHGHLDAGRAGGDSESAAQHAQHAQPRGDRAGHQDVRADRGSLAAVGRIARRSALLQLLSRRRRVEIDVQRQPRRHSADRLADSAGGAARVPRAPQPVRRRAHARRLVHHQRRDAARHERDEGVGVPVLPEQRPARARRVPASDARTATPTTYKRTPYDRQQFGFNLRGPIVKDKLFFAGELRARQHERQHLRSCRAVRRSIRRSGISSPGTFSAPTKNHTGVLRLTSPFSDKHTERPDLRRPLLRLGDVLRGDRVARVGAHGEVLDPQPAAARYVHADRLDREPGVGAPARVESQRGSRSFRARARCTRASAFGRNTFPLDSARAAPARDRQAHVHAAGRKAHSRTRASS